MLLWLPAISIGDDDENNKNGDVGGLRGTIATPGSLRFENNVGDALIWGNAPADVPVPGPAILALLGIGLTGMGIARKRAKA